MMNFLEKLEEGLQSWVDSIRWDVKDHIFVSVVYMLFVFGLNAAFSDEVALYAVYFGFAVAIFWEFLRAKFKWKNISVPESIVDLICYILVLFPYTMKLWGNI